MLTLRDRILSSIDRLRGMAQMPRIRQGGIQSLALQLPGGRAGLEAQMSPALGEYAALMPEQAALPQQYQPVAPWSPPPPGQPPHGWGMGGHLGAGVAPGIMDQARALSPQALSGVMPQMPQMPQSQMPIGGAAPTPEQRPHGSRIPAMQAAQHRHPHYVTSSLALARSQPWAQGVTQPTMAVRSA